MKRPPVTPGPWMLTQVGTIISLDGYARAPLLLIDPVNKSQDWTDKAKANARAISTLPDLLEALEEIAGYTGEGGPGTPWRDIVRDLGTKARTVLKKAGYEFEN